MKTDQNSFLKIIACTCSAIALTISNTHAQTSVFQDASGESAFKVFGNAITINATDQNISFSSDFINRGTVAQFKTWGIFAKVTANEGIANVKSEDGFLIDGALGGYRSWVWAKDLTLMAPGPGWKREFYVSLNALVDRNNLFNLANNQDEIIFTKGHLGWKNEIGGCGYYGAILWGASVNWGLRTNVGDIDTKTISTLLQRSANDTTYVVDEQTAYDKAEFKSNLLFFNLNADIGSAILKNVADGVGSLIIAVHLRYQTLETVKPTFNPAIGLYISQVGSPFDIAAGLNVQFIDASNTGEADNTSWQRAVVNLTAGFKLD